MQRESLIAELKQKYGPLLGPSALMPLLEFKSQDSCAKALRSGTLNVRAFRLPGRPGHFVFTEDLADWLLAARESADSRHAENPASRLEEVPNYK